MKSKLDRIAIGPCASDTADANAAVGPRHVFDDDRLPKRASHPLGHEAPNSIGRTACGDRHDHGDRPGRIGLSACDARDDRQRDSTRCQMQELSPAKFHGALPKVALRHQLLAGCTYREAFTRRTMSVIGTPAQKSGLSAVGTSEYLLIVLM